MTYSAEGRNEEHVLLGVVGVDSGQLMVIDPSYIDTEWRSADGSDVVAVEFWGRDQTKVARRLRGDPVVGSITRPHGIYRVTPAEGFDLDAVERAVKGYCRPDEVVVTSRHSTSSYDEVGDVTMGGRFLKQGGGQLNFKMGHPGLAVAFSAGFGDGVYQVWAVVRDYGLYGRRVAEVRIVMVEEPCKTCGDEGWLIVETDEGLMIQRCNACEVMTDGEARADAGARQALGKARNDRWIGRLMAQRVANAMGVRAATEARA